MKKEMSQQILRKYKKKKKVHEQYKQLNANKFNNLEEMGLVWKQGHCRCDWLR